MNTTKETVDFYSLLKKESGFKVENEGAALNLIQKAFDKFKVDLIKVNDPQIVKPREKIYIIAVGYYHIAEDKIGFYSYFGVDKKSCSNLVWTNLRHGVEFKRINNTHCALKISEKQLRFLKIDISKCEILFEL